MGKPFTSMFLLEKLCGQTWVEIKKKLIRLRSSCPQQSDLHPEVIWDLGRLGAGLYPEVILLPLAVSVHFSYVKLNQNWYMFSLLLWEEKLKYPKSLNTVLLTYL